MAMPRGGAPPRSTTAEFWRGILLWALIPGNVLALVLLISIQVQGWSRKPTIVYRHVYHHDASMVWRKDEAAAPNQSVRQNVAASTSLLHTVKNDRDRLAHTLAEGHDGSAKGILEGTNFEVLYLYSTKPPVRNGRGKRSSVRVPGDEALAPPSSNEEDEDENSGLEAPPDDEDLDESFDGQRAEAATQGAEAEDGSPSTEVEIEIDTEQVAIEDIEGEDEEGGDVEDEDDEEALANAARASKSSPSSGRPGGSSKETARKPSLSKRKPRSKRLAKPKSRRKHASKRKDVDGGDQDDVDVEEAAGEGEQEEDEVDEEEGEELEPPSDQRGVIREDEEKEVEEVQQGIAAQASGSQDGAGLESEFGDADDFVVLPVQVKPLHRHTFANFRTSSCTYLCELLKEHKWKLTTKSPAMVLIRWYSYDKYKSLKRSMVNHIGSGSGCIGGGKGTQLRCRQEYTLKHGCEYNSLAVQPRQWNLQDTSECKTFFDVASEDRLYIRKPGGSQHGKGITVHRGTDGLKANRPCRRKLREGLIVQEYLAAPLLLGGHKFDLRTYLLVASTSPTLAFFHEGFVRRSERPYAANETDDLEDPRAHVTNSVKQSAENHFFSFDHLAREMANEHKFPLDYLRTAFRRRVVDVSRFLVHSANIERRRGRFQVFALDWMLDRDGGVHLLEANGDPSLVSYPGIGLTPNVWTSMFDLVNKIHTAPTSLRIPRLSALAGGHTPAFSFEGWHLFYNELADDVVHANVYNPCSAFSSPRVPS